MRRFPFTPFAPVAVLASALLVTGLLTVLLWQPSRASSQAGAVVGGDPFAQAPALFGSSSSGGAGQEAAHGPEIPGLRTASSRTFVGPGGARVAQVFTKPIHYRASGKWRAIDSRLVAASRAGYAYRNAANSYGVELPARLEHAPVRVTSRGETLSFALEGAQGAPSVTGNRARYRAALPGVGLVYEAEADAVKESLVLADSSAPNRFEFGLRASGALTVHETADGGVELVDGKGAAVFSIPAPFMVDSSGSTSSAVSMDVKRDAGGGHLLTLEADRAWLERPERKWPVTVDPTVAFSGALMPPRIDAAESCFIDSASPSQTFCTGWDRLEVGRAHSANHRALLRFDVGSAVPRDADVLHADMRLQAFAQTPGNPPRINLHRVTRAWDAGTTWNNATASTPWTTPGGDFVSGPDAFHPGRTGPGEWEFQPSPQLVQGWVDGSIANQGVLLKTAEDVDNLVQFRSVRYSDVNQRPYIAVTYEPRVGMRRQYSFERQRLSDTLQAGVNVANGNLLLRQSDLTIPGIAGFDLHVERFYNNLSSQYGEVGRGWRLNFGGWVGLQRFFRESTGESAVLYGPSGFAALFQGKADGTYTAPSGLDAKLDKHADDTYTLKFHQTEEVYRFDASGYLTERRDRNDNRIAYQFTDSGELTQVTDTRGRITSFGRRADGFMTSMTDPASRGHTYEVSPGALLEGYLDPAGKRYDYDYDVDLNLEQITDPNGNVVKFAYDSQRRITSITRVTDAQAGTGPTTSFNYNPSGANCPSGTRATETTDPRGNKTTYCHDRQSRVTRVTDAEGHRQSRRYTSNSNVDLYTAGSGADTSAGYDSSNRLTSITSPSETGSQPAVRRLSYNAGNSSFRPDTATDAQNNTLSLAYTTDGNLRQVRESGSQTPQVEIEYNDGGAGDAADNGTVRFSKDGNGNQTNYVYNAKAELERIDYPNGVGAGSAALGDVTYTYDSLSRVRTVTDGKGQQQTYFYDPIDRIDKIEYRNSAGTLVQTIDYTWDANGNPVGRSDATGAATFVYDSLNRLIEERKPNRPTILYSYDAASNLASVTAGGEQITYTYFPDNTIESLFEPDPTPGNGVDDRPKTEFRYNVDNSRTKTIYPNTVTEDVTYDRAERPKTIKATRPGQGTPLTDFEYRWTASGATQERDLLQRAIDNRLGRTTDYSYDALNRLQLASTTGSATFSYGYDYDNASNRTKLRRQGAVTRSYAYDNNNRLCWQANVDSSAACGSPPGGATTFDYDANGNLTTASDGFSAAYNALNQTTSMDPAGTPGAFSLAYAGRGQAERIQKGAKNFTDTVLGMTIDQAGATTINFVRDEKGKFVAQRTTSSGTLTRRYPLFDQLGSVVATTGPSGGVSGRFEYEDPFGDNPVVSGSPNTTVRFAAGYLDTETGLYKFGARYYNPGLGRWTQRDPLNQAFSPREANRYVYAAADPVNLTDPSGTNIFDDVVDAVKKGGEEAVEFVKGNSGKLAKAAGKAAAPACYTYKALRDREDSIKDELRDLNDCFNPFAWFGE